MSAVMSKDDAAAAARAAVAERDNIQANLLDLDASFGKRMLDGAKLTGQTKERWDAASAGLVGLWETFSAYSAVIDRITTLAADLGRAPAAKVAEISRLLGGRSVRVALAPAPLGERALTATPTAEMTIASALSAMKRTYAEVSSLCAAAEAIWTEIADDLQVADADLEQAERRAAGLADPELASLISLARPNLGRLREMLNSDPLALGPAGAPGSTGPIALARLRQQVADASRRATELDRLRTGAARRIASVTAAVATATSAWQDATAAQQRSSVRIANSPPQPLADPGELADRVAGLGSLQAAARWGQLATELDTLDKDVAAAQRHYRDANAAAMAALGRRDELRGLLEAYQAKAAALGGAENELLVALYDEAHEMLWTAPCDLAAATGLLTSYQRAVLELEVPGGES